jgi:hypothetical protein
MAFGRENSLALALALMNPRPGQSQLKPKPEKAKVKAKKPWLFGPRPRPEHHYLPGLLFDIAQFGCPSCLSHKQQIIWSVFSLFKIQPFCPPEAF